MDILPTLEARVSQLETGHSNMRQHLTRLDEDIREIRDILAHSATKEDILDLRLLIERSMNGLLRDALNSVPAKQALIWSAVTVLIALAALFVSIFHVHFGSVTVTPPIIDHSPLAYFQYH